MFSKCSSITTIIIIIKIVSNITKQYHKMIKQPTNGELALMIKNVSEKIDDFKNENKSGHDEIIKHQIVTNGRVNKLETFRDNVKGATTVITIVIVPVMLYMLYSIINI